MHDEIADQPLTNARLPFLYSDPPTFWVTPHFTYQALCGISFWPVQVTCPSYARSHFVFLLYLLTGRAWDEAGKKKSLNSHKHNLAKSKTWLCYHSKSKTALWWLLRRNHPSCNQDHTDHLFHIICVMPSFTLPNIPSPSLFICFDRYTNLILLVNGTRLSVHKTSTPLKVCWIHLVHDFGLHTW